MPCIYRGLLCQPFFLTIDGWLKNGVDLYFDGFWGFINFAISYYYKILKDNSQVPTSSTSIHMVIL